MIFDGFTGFLVTSSSFSGIPENVGLLASVNYDYFMWIQMDRLNGEGGWPWVGFAQFSGEESAGMVRLVNTLKGTKKKTLHFIEHENKLVVAYESTRSKC